MHEADARFRECDREEGTMTMRDVILSSLDEEAAGAS